MWRLWIVPAQEAMTTRRTTSVTRRSLSSSSVTSIRLYRVLSRHIKTLPNEFLLQRPLDSSDYGRARLFHSPPSSQSSSYQSQQHPWDVILRTFRWWHGADDWYHSIVTNPAYYPQLRTLLPQQESWSDTDNDNNNNVDVDDDDNNSKPLSCWTTQGQLREAVQLAFRMAPVTMQRYAVQAYPHVVEQLSLWKASSVSVQHGIRIVALSGYMGEELSGNKHPVVTKYRFKYRIRVENVNSVEPVQLLGRMWQIQDMDAIGDLVGDPIVVNAPTTGVGECVCVCD
jgi:hypothetical protein